MEGALSASCSASSACWSERPPRLASGTELRRHQIDALAGMLTELIAANQKGFARLSNGNGVVPAEELVEVEPEENGELGRRT